MKKIFLLVIMCLLVTGCFNTELDNEKKLYNNFIDKLNNTNEDSFNTQLPCDINVYLEKMIDEEVTYRIIIDNPKETLKNIKAIAIHDYDTEDIFPTIGIFDTPLNLKPNVIDKDNNYVKGIILTGYIPFKKDINQFDSPIKVLMTYEDEENNLHEVLYWYHK